MKIIFLGTSHATPTAKKGQTAILLRYKDENILVDCGEGTQRQFKIAKLNPCKLTRILITHWHGDHIFGLPGLLQTLALNNYSKILHIYGPKGTKKFMDLILKMFIFTGSINVKVHEIKEGKNFLETTDFILSAYKMMHGPPCLAYSFTEKNKRKINMQFIKKMGIKQGPLLGKLQQGRSISFKGKEISVKQATTIKKGRKISFILDTLINKNCISAAKNSDLLITESTFLESKDSDKARKRFHLTAKQSATIAKQAKVQELILTHISHRYAKNESAILDEAKKIFKNCRLAKDFMEIIL